jgi:hypothetical protein
MSSFMVWFSEFLDLLDFAAECTFPLDEKRMHFGCLGGDGIGAALKALAHQLENQLLGIQSGNATVGKFLPAGVIGGRQGHGKFL